MESFLIKPVVTAFLISVIFTPFLIKLSRKKGLMASVDHRSSHDDDIPNTGGIVLGFATLLPLILYSDYPKQEDFSFLLSAFAVLLITGVIDDFNPIPVAFKFLGQFIPAIVIVLSIEEQELVIPFLNQNLNIPYFFNYLFWIVFIVMSINAFNLIDGIDGLAISLGIAGGVFYLFKFTSLGSSDLALFSISLVGGLLGLLFFNFAKKNKIFIGDTGSLLIGGLLVFFGLKFISLSDSVPVSSSFFWVIGSFFVPFADMIRVAMVRIVHKDSPFKADRLHIHHLVVDACKGNHFLATLILVSIQVVAMLVFQSISFGNDLIMFSITVAMILTYITLVYIFTRIVKKHY